MDAFVSTLYHINAHQEKLFEYDNGKIHFMTKRDSGKQILTLTDMLAKIIESNLWKPLLKDKAAEFINAESNSQAIKYNISLFKSPWLDCSSTDSNVAIHLAESFLKQLRSALGAPTMFSNGSTKEGEATVSFRNFNIQSSLEKLTDIAETAQSKYSEGNRATSFIAAFKWLAFDDETLPGSGLGKSSVDNEATNRRRSRIGQGKVTKLIDSKIEAIGQAFLAEHDFLSEPFRQQFSSDAFKGKNALGKYYCILMGALIFAIVYERSLVKVGRSTTAEDFSAIDSFFRGALHKVIKKSGNPEYWVERTGICLTLMDEPFVREIVPQGWKNRIKADSKDIQNPKIVSQPSTSLLDTEYHVLITVLDVLYLPLKLSQKDAEVNLPNHINPQEVSKRCIEKYGWVLHRLAIIFYCRWFEYKYPRLQLERSTKNQIVVNDKPLLLWYLKGLKSLEDVNQNGNSKAKQVIGQPATFPVKLAEYADVAADISEFETDSSLPGALNFWGDYFWRKIDQQAIFKEICELVQEDYPEELYRISNLEKLTFFAPMQSIFVPKAEEKVSKLGRQEKTTEKEFKEFLHFNSEEKKLGAWAKELVAGLSEVFGFTENLAQLFFDGPRIKLKTKDDSFEEQRTRDARTPKLKSFLLESTFFNDQESKILPPDIEIVEGPTQRFNVIYDGIEVNRFPDDWVHKTRKKDSPLLTVVKKLSFSSLCSEAGDPIDPNEAVISERLRYTMARIKRYLFISRIVFEQSGRGVPNNGKIEELENHMFYHLFACSIEDRLLLLDPRQKTFKQKDLQTENMQSNAGESAMELDEYDLSEFLESYLDYAEIKETLSNWMSEPGSGLPSKTKEILTDIRNAYVWEVSA